MQRYTRMRIKLHGHGLRLVGGEVVRDQVDFLARRLDRNRAVEKAEKLGSSMPGSGHPVQAARFHLQGRGERQGAIALVLEAVAFPARPDDIGITGSSWSSACIAVFASTQKTTALVGGAS